MKRADLLGLLRFAGYHGDSAAFTRLLVEHRISRRVADDAYSAGRAARVAGQRCGCTDCAAPPRTDLATCSLAFFATEVLVAVARIGGACDERFGDRKVFISAIWTQLADTRGSLTLNEFKARLILALRAGHLELARADLVGAMPAAVVTASEIRHRGAEFHFVLDPAAREPWERAS